MIELPPNRANEIVSTIELLYGIEPNSVFEIRILNTKQRTVSGYFDSPDAAVNAIIPYISVNDIYITLNPPDPSLLARSSNKLMPYAKQTTSDSDIDRIRWILVDLDPVRKAGISASVEEKKQAAILAKGIRKGLEEFGFPKPVLSDSGNGYHLLYKADFPNCKENTDSIKNFLLALDFLYSTDKVMVDRSTFNPSRIVKLYGTMSCKGEDTEERPHRWSKVIKAPTDIHPVSMDLLELVIAKLPKAEVQPRGRSAKKSLDFHLHEWLEGYGIEIAFSADFHGDGTKYIPAVCPWREEHTNRSAYILQFKNGAIAAGCHHNSCQDENWHTLRDKYEPDWRSHMKEKAEKSNGSEKQMDVLIRLGDEAKFFHDESEDAYVCVPVKEHQEVYKVSSSRFKYWLSHRYYMETGKAFNQESYTQAVGIFTGMAKFDGETKKLYRRCAWVDDAIYYDLNNEKKEIVRITRSGWEIIPNCNVYFERSKTMLPQVTPAKSGEINLEIFYTHYRFKSEEDKILHAVSLITKFLSHIAHPIDVVYGEKGASKTTTQQKDRSLVDPNQSDVLVLPKARDDLALLLKTHYFPCFDNLSKVSHEMSDLLCVAATGGSYVKRTLYTNDEETVFKFRQPVSLNGINVVATNADLIDRSIILELERIDKTERITSSQLWADFNKDKPMILGTFFSILAKAIEIIPTIQIDELGRMADFTRWGYAVAEAAGIGGETFLAAYLKNQARANNEALDSHPIASAVMKMMKDKKTWSGTASSLLQELNTIAAQEHFDTKSNSWAKQPNQLSRRLREVKSNLAEIDIDVDISGRRTISIKNKKIEY